MQHAHVFPNLIKTPAIAKAAASFKKYFQRH
jgi:hypothetical protein